MYYYFEQNTENILCKEKKVKFKMERTTTNYQSKTNTVAVHLPMLLIANTLLSNYLQL